MVRASQPQEGCVVGTAYVLGLPHACAPSGAIVWLRWFRFPLVILQLDHFNLRVFTLPKLKRTDSSQTRLTLIFFNPFLSGTAADSFAREVLTSPPELSPLLLSFCEG